MKNRKIVYLTYALFSTIAFALFYYGYLNNKLLKLNKLKKEISQNQLNYNKINKMLSEINDINDDLLLLKHHVNAYFEPYKIIDNIDNLINKHELLSLQFNIDQPKKHIIKDENEEQTVYVCTISLKLSGDYNNIRSLIDELELNSYKISMLSFMPASNKQIEASLLLNSFSKELTKSIEDKSIDSYIYDSRKNPFH